MTVSIDHAVNLLHNAICVCEFTLPLPAVSAADYVALIGTGSLYLSLKLKF